MLESDLTISEFERRHLTIAQAVACGGMGETVTALNWIKHDLVPNVEPSRGRGTVRHYSLENVVHLSAMKLLSVDANIKPSEASAYAQKVVNFARIGVEKRHWREQVATVMLLWRDEERTVKAIAGSQEVYSRLILGSQGTLPGSGGSLPPIYVVIAAGRWVASCFETYLTSHGNGSKPSGSLHGIEL